MPVTNPLPKVPDPSTALCLDQICAIISLPPRKLFLMLSGEWDCQFRRYQETDLTMTMQ